jgi:hypothetical protein
LGVFGLDLRWSTGKEALEVICGRMEMSEDQNWKNGEVKGTTVARANARWKGKRSGQLLGFLRATNFGGICFANREKVNKATGPQVCPRWSRRRTVGALKPEASKSSGKVISRHGRWKQLLFTLGLLIRIIFHLKEM